jgi:transposase
MFTKKTISYCVKDGSGQIHAEGAIPATRFDLDRWMKTLPQPWTAAMEATLFTGWIYDHLQPHAAALKVAHPLMLRAIAAAKKKNDRIDAHKIADCLRCDFLPECYMASSEIRERRRTLRYRNLLVRQAVQLKNKIAVLLMEAGVSYNKQKLHKVGYFRELLATNKDIDEGLKPLLRLCRETLGAPRQDGKCLTAITRAGSAVSRTRGATHGHSRRRPRDGSDLGTGSWRRAALFIHQKGGQLLRTVRSGEEFRRDGETHTNFQTP